MIVNWLFRVSSSHGRPDADSKEVKNRHSRTASAPRSGIQSIGTSVA